MPESPPTLSRPNPGLPGPGRKSAKGTSRRPFDRNLRPGREGAENARCSVVVDQASCPGRSANTGCYPCGATLERFSDLRNWAHRGAYRAWPSRRMYIEKEDGKERPLGGAALEDRTVQQAVITVRNSILRSAGDFMASESSIDQATSVSSSPLQEIRREGVAVISTAPEAPMSRLYRIARKAACSQCTAE